MIIIDEFSVHNQNLDQENKIESIISRDDVKVYTDNLTAKITNFLKTAKSEIVISTYRFNNLSIIGLVKELALMGIKVRIMVNEQYLKECNDLFKKCGKIAEHVEITHGNRNYLVHHNKYIVIDNKAAFIMTGNLDTHLGKSTDFIVYLKASDICKNLLHIFQYDWDNRSAIPIDSKYIFNKSGLYWSDGSVDRVDNKYKQYYVDDIVNDTYFKNHGSSLAAYIKLVEGAKKSIKIYMQLVNSFECIKYLCEAAQRGVKVEAIFQSLGNHKLDAFIKGLLERHGVSVVYNKKQVPYVHAKVIIADEKEVMLGSMNFSYASTNLNRELDIIINGSEVKKLVNKFNKDFSTIKSSTVASKYKFHHPYVEEAENQILDDSD